MTGFSEGMFDPFTDDEFQAAERTAHTDKCEDPKPIVPAPADAPEPDWSELRPKEATGEPVKVWLYHMGDGEFAFYVVRWEPKDPKEPKIVRPVTWCRFSWWARAVGAQGDASAQATLQPARDRPVSWQARGRH